MCRACRTAWRDTFVPTSATRTTRVQGRRHSVDCGGHVHLTFFRKLFLRLIQIQRTKDLNLCTRALLLLRRPPCWNKHGATRSSRRARHVVRVVSRRDEQSGICISTRVRGTRTQNIEISGDDGRAVPVGGVALQHLQVGGVVHTLSANIEH